MTLQIKLPSSFTDTTLPKLQIDPLLPEAGALSLWDLGDHPGDPAPLVGLPALGVNTPLHNIAWEQAAAAIGSGTISTLRPILYRNSNADVADRSKTERTTKGGLHLITSQANDVGASAPGAGVYMNDLIEQYIVSNPSNDLYVSAWGRVTRPHVATANAHSSLLELCSTSSPTSNYRAMLFVDAEPSVGSSGGARLDGGAANGPAFANARTNAWQGTAAATTGALSAQWGIGITTIYASSSALRRALASRALYRGYVEDLTVSGRTYAEVDALDYALYVKDCLTPGGRFYGDTFTDPATIP